MADKLKTRQTIALIAAAISLTCACGIPLGPQDHYPPPSVKRALDVRYRSSSVATRVGTPAQPMVFLIKNISGEPVALDPPSLYSIHHGEAFHLDTTCGPTLAPGSTCSITLTFSPTRRSDSEVRLLFSAKPAESYGLIVDGVALRP